MITGLRRFRDLATADAKFDRCEMCAEPIGQHHGHVVNLDSRTLLCTCHSCHQLFIRPGAAQGRFRGVPDRYLHLPQMRMSAADWEELRIPVRMAFFFHDSTLGRSVACYPSPAGAIRSELTLNAWEPIMAANPRLSSLRPDVEAVLVDRGEQGEDGGEEGFACYLVPIDACYELVGLMRRNWKGTAGGRQARDAIDAYFALLRQRSHAWASGGIDLD